MPRTNLQACGAVHYQYQNPLDSQVSTSTSTINAYINIKMATPTNKQNQKKPVKK